MSLISRHNILEILTTNERLELDNITNSDTKRKFETGMPVVLCLKMRWKYISLEVLL